MLEQTFETPTPPRLDLSVPSGLIEIETTADGRTELRLDASDEVLERTTVEQHGDTVVVHVEDKWGLFGGRGRGVVLRLRCPEGASLKARSKSADVRVRGRLDRADVASASGDVLLETVDGDASVKTASGDVEIRSTGGALEVNTASGDVAAGSVGGTMRVNAVSGDVRVESCDGAASVQAVSGDVELLAVRSGRVQAQTVSGDVEVGVRRGSRVHVDASTLSGDTRSDLDLSGDPIHGDGPVVELRLKSVSGDISVVRAHDTSPQEVQS
ncbi:MAG: DUF4097 family beta strand repeat-containing protein [Gaiellaceae bacterium]